MWQCVPDIEEAYSRRLNVMAINNTWLAQFQTRNKDSDEMLVMAWRLQRWVAVIPKPCNQGRGGAWGRSIHAEILLQLQLRFNEKWGAHSVFKEHILA